MSIQIFNRASFSWCFEIMLSVSKYCKYFLVTSFICYRSVVLICVRVLYLFICTSLFYNFASTLILPWKYRRKNAAAVHDPRSAEQYLTPYELPTHSTLYILLTSYVVQYSVFAVILFLLIVQRSSTKSYVVYMSCSCSGCILHKCHSVTPFIVCLDIVLRWVFYAVKNFYSLCDNNNS